MSEANWHIHINQSNWGLFCFQCEKRMFADGRTTVWVLIPEYGTYYCQDCKEKIDDLLDGKGIEL